MLNGPFVSFVISVTSHWTHILYLCGQICMHIHTWRQRQTKQTHSITLGDRAFRAVIPDIFKKFGQTAQKKISRTRWILIRLFKNRTKMLKPRLKLGYSHWWKCTICILANIWHIFIDEHNICSDCQLPVADAEDQAQLCKHFGHFKYLVFYLSAYTTRKSQNHSAVSTSPKKQQES